MREAGAYEVGQRVRHRADGRVGVVTDAVPVDGSALYTVSFPDGEWDVESAVLEPLAAPGAAPPTARTVEFNPYRAWLRREALRLLDAYRNDPAAALSNSRIEPKHHQVSVALRALDKSQPRLILADEVGLGKTIEAGLILKELRSRGVLDRVLVIVPANLVTQWQHELSTKFNEHFVYADSARLERVRQEAGLGENPWSSGPNLICSLQYVRRDEQREALAAAHWDLVIVDEAHHARRTLDGANKGYHLLVELRDRVAGLLLLSATPLQLHEYELYSMVELVEPGLFEDYEHFVRSREQIAALNEHVAWLRLPAGDHDRTQQLYRMLRTIDAPEKLVYLDPSKPAERARLIEWCESQHRLSQALVRNRKAEVGGFTQRVARRIPVEPTMEERNLEEAVHDYIRRQYRANPAQGLVLVTFRKILASSTEALARAFESRAQRLLERTVEDLEALSDDADVADELNRALSARSADVEAEIAELEGLAAQARAARDSKLDGLVEALEGVLGEHPDEKILIFTQFIGTLEMIRERLADRFSVAAFHGGMPTQEKDRAVRAFRDDAQVMVSSEAGGEGRNFQFCHILVNYDLPWNPMKVEQRIGRLDRVGQSRDVLIHNFELRGTLDEQILDVLDGRIRVFTETVGALDPILGDVERELERIYLLDPQQAAREFTRFEVNLETKLHQARQREEQLRDLILDARSFRHDEVNELLGCTPKATPTDLEHFVRTVLEPYPTANLEERRGGLVEVVLPPRLLQEVRQRRGTRLKDRYIGTFDLRTAVDQEHVEFFAFGHPLVEALIQFHLQEPDTALPALECPALDERGIAFDYQVRFGGVRPKEWLLTNVATESRVSPTPGVPAPSRWKDRVEPSEAPAEWVQRLRTSSRAAANAAIQDEFDRFQSENERLYEEERTRLEKLYSFQVRYFENRIMQNEQLIREWELFGTDEQRRTIPARRGLVNADRERIARVDEEREGALRQLEMRRAATQEVRLAGMTLLRPAQVGASSG